jgi:hypothetical protein
MFKIIIACSIFLSASTAVLSQPADRPFNNFSAKPGLKSIEYQKVFEVPDSIKSIKSKLKSLIQGSAIFSQVNYDSNSCSGVIGKIYPSYYNNSKELRGAFKIEIKNGRYRLTISGMTLNGSIFSDDLEAVVMSSNYMEWNYGMAQNILPDLDDMLTRIFTIQNSSSSNW